MCRTSSLKTNLNHYPRWIHLRNSLKKRKSRRKKRERTRREQDMTRILDFMLPSRGRPFRCTSNRSSNRSNQRTIRSRKTRSQLCPICSTIARVCPISLLQQIKNLKSLIRGSRQGRKLGEIREKNSANIEINNTINITITIITILGT